MTGVNVKAVYEKLEKSLGKHEIPVKEALPLRPLPPKYLVILRKHGLAKMLMREGIRYLKSYGLKKEVIEAIFSRPCIYGVFDRKLYEVITCLLPTFLREPVSRAFERTSLGKIPLGGFWPKREKCVACLRCWIEHGKEVVIDVMVNPKFKKLGDSYFTSYSVWRINREATTGGDVTRGMGYQGEFAGPELYEAKTQFDAIWTDMSEIVRPTRHGKLNTEYISTEVEIGRKPLHLATDSSGKLLVKEKVVKSSVPILFDYLPPNLTNEQVKEAIAKATEKVKNFAIFSVGNLKSKTYGDRIIPLVRDKDIDHHKEVIKNAKIIEYVFGNVEGLHKLKQQNPDSIISVRVPCKRGVEETAYKLVEEGADAVHIFADYHGKEFETYNPRYITELIKSVHSYLVEKSVRDEVTLIASGGIKRSEHVAKSIILGVDLVGIDMVVLLALQAKFNGEVRSPKTARVTLYDIQKGPVTVNGRSVLSFDWASQRLANLVNSWKEQHIEILSAKGIRDVRRERGEMGRAMFNEIEEEELKAYVGGRFDP